MATQTQDTVMTIDELARYLKLATSTHYKPGAEGKSPRPYVGHAGGYRK